MPLPKTIDGDSWIGIANNRDYSPEHLPFSWRGFYDFGCGAPGERACHVLGAPTSVECLMQEPSVMRHE